MLAGLVPSGGCRRESVFQTFTASTGRLSILSLACSPETVHLRLGLEPTAWGTNPAKTQIGT